MRAYRNAGAGRTNLQFQRQSARTRYAVGIGLDEEQICRRGQLSTNAARQKLLHELHESEQMSATVPTSLQRFAALRVATQRPQRRAHHALHAMRANTTRLRPTSMYAA